MGMPLHLQATAVVVTGNVVTAHTRSGVCTCALVFVRSLVMRMPTS